MPKSVIGDLQSSSELIQELDSMDRSDDPDLGEEDNFRNENRRNSSIPVERTSTPKRSGEVWQGTNNDQDEVEKIVPSCDDFRQELLNSPLSNIALDVSPPRSVNQPQNSSAFRDWTDYSGKIIASGTMVDLRRGYVIIEGTAGRQKISVARLGEADLASIAGSWLLPTECLVNTGTFGGRCWEPQTVTWYASSICHKPLYFENVQLERYGHSAGPIMGPIRASAHFFGSVALFPYHTGIHPPNECHYALGYYRPGDCAPWLSDPFPVSLKGAVRQGKAVTGGFFLF